MPQITNKIKFSGLLTMLLVASWMFISCGKEKKADETETVPADTTEQVIEPKMAPDSLPPVDTSASTRPEPRKT